MGGAAWVCGTAWLGNSQKRIRRIGFPHTLESVGETESAPDKKIRSGFRFVNPLNKLKKKPDFLLEPKSAADFWGGFPEPKSAFKIRFSLHKDVIISL